MQGLLALWARMLDPARHNQPGEDIAPVSAKSATWRRAGLLFFLLPFLISSHSALSAQTEDLHLGVIAPYGTVESIERWQPTVDFLNTRIEGSKIQLRPYVSVDEMAVAAGLGVVDYIITTPSSYVALETSVGASKLLSLVSAWQGVPLSRFGSVVFTLQKNGDVLTFRDLRGMNVLAVGRHAFGGWQMVKEEFIELGLDPEKFLNSVTFANGSQNDIVYAVLNGTTDAGIVRTGTLEQMAANGLINIEDFHIVAQRTVEGFPFALSTDLYPEWYFAELPTAPQELTGLISESLLGLDPESREAVAGRYYGWRPPLSDHRVHLMLQNLRAPPYETFGLVSAKVILMSYKYWILVVAAGLVAVVTLLSFIARRNVQLSRARGEIIRLRESELNFKNRARDEHAIVTITDAKGVITFANDKFIEISGYSSEELIGNTHAMLKSGTHDEKFYADLWSTIKSGRVWFGDVQNRCKDGSLYWLKTTIVPNLDENGLPIEFVTMRTDITDAKVTQSKMQVKQFFGLLRNEVYMFAPDTLSVFYTNQTARDTIGLTEAAIQGRSFLDVIPELDTGGFREKLVTLAGGVELELLLEVKRTLNSGAEVFSELHILFVKPDGLGPRFVATLWDITERKAVENEVRQLTATLDHIVDEVYMFWPDTKKFFYANMAARNRLGVPEEELFGMTPSDLEGGFTMEEVAAVLNPMIEGHSETAKFIKEHYSRSGKRRATEYDVQLVQPDGEKPRFVAVLRNVTDRVNAEETIRQLSSSLNLIQNEVYVFWPDTYEIIYLNQSAMARGSWVEDEWRGRRISERISSRQQAALESRCRALIEGEVKSLVFETVDRAGNHLEIYLHLLEPKSEKPRFISVYRDITEHKKAERAKAEFISTVSHELRTPLTSIKGALGLSLAGAGGDLSDKQRSLLNIAHKNSDRLALLINDILDIEKLDAGKVDIEKTEIDLAELVRGAVEANEPYGRRFGVTFVTYGIDMPIIVNGNMDRLMQVMDNLLSNAAKFSDQGGQVDVLLTANGSHARISVADHGIGIPVEAQGKIFGRFFQVDSTDVRKKGGTGLGLSIAKAIVEAHDGEITFISEEGQGTTFNVQLPIAVPGVKRRAATPSGLPVVASRRVISRRKQ